MYNIYILVSVAGLSYVSEIEKRDWINVKGNSQFKNRIGDFEKSDNVKLAQSFIYEQLSIVANLSMISKVIDALVNFENTDQGNIFNFGL